MTSCERVYAVVNCVADPDLIEPPSFCQSRIFMRIRICKKRSRTTEVPVVLGFCLGQSWIHRDPNNFAGFD